MSFIAEDVQVGDNCVIGPGACIGQRGFGYKRLHGEWVYREHPFSVVIEDDVNIGANTCINRGRHRHTLIGRGTKIDDLVFIAHNVLIGKRCLIIAKAMIAGSCEIGDDVIIGPGACLRDHVKVGAGAFIGVGAVVIKDVPAGQVWAGNPARYIRDVDGQELA